MADYEHIVPVCSTVDDCYIDPSAVPAFMIGHYCLFTLCLATFIYGVTSWYLIRKFRNFNNYVYLSANLVNILRLTVVTITLIHCEAATVDFRDCITMYWFIIFLHLTTVYNCWLLVMCYMFYVHIVKVFHKDIEKKYLKSSIFAWAVPSVIWIVCAVCIVIIHAVSKRDKWNIIHLFITVCSILFCNVLPSFINLVIFIKLVSSLFFGKATNAGTVSIIDRRKERLRRLCTSTAMFVLSNVVVLTFVIFDLFRLTVEVRAVMLSLQIAAMALFVPLLKSNRSFWHEYCVNRFKGLSRDFCCVGCRNRQDDR